jgi:hypothetical protein
MSTLIYALSIFIGLMGTVSIYFKLTRYVLRAFPIFRTIQVLFLRLSLQSMEREYDLIENIYSKALEKADTKTDVAVSVKL